MKKYKLNVKKRDGLGRGPARRLRAAGAIPGVIYGKSGSKPVAIDAVEFRMMMRAKGESAALVEIAVDGAETLLSLIKDFQRDAVSQKVVHVAIPAVDPNVQMTATIPVHIKGEAIGVLQENATLEAVHEIIVRCLPKDLPEFIEVDVSGLHAGHTIHIDALPPIPGVTFPANQNTVVASCTVEKQEEEPAPAAEGEAAPADAAAPAPEKK